MHDKSHHDGEINTQNLPVARWRHLSTAAMGTLGPPAVVPRPLNIRFCVFDRRDISNMLHGFGGTLSHSAAVPPGAQ